MALFLWPTLFELSKIIKCAISCDPVVQIAQMLYHWNALIFPHIFRGSNCLQRGMALFLWPTLFELSKIIKCAISCDPVVQIAQMLDHWNALIFPHIFRGSNCLQRGIALLLWPNLF